MKHTYKKFVLVAVAVVMAIAGMAYWKHLIPNRDHGSSVSQTAHKNDKAVPQETLSRIQQNLAEREYHISYDSLKSELQSPNRSQGMRAYYQPGKLTVINRKDSAGSDFRLDLVNEGIYADGQKLYEPASEAEAEPQDNRLHIRHPGFTEEYINDTSGVRQNFIVERASEGTRSLEVRLNISGMQVTSAENGKMVFASGSNKLIYHDLHCWDADHNTLPASLAYTGGQIVISVDVRDADFPVTIDPLIVNGNPGNVGTLLKKDQALSNMGFAVSTAGDVNGDGYSDVIVGAPFYDNGHNNEGAAFVYHGSATGLGGTPASILESNQADSKFGMSVSNAGDVNGDGLGDVIVGAPLYDNQESNEGAAYVYHGATVAGINTVAAVILESNQPNANLGQSVALAGDVDGNGFSDVIVGANMYDKNENNEGVAFVYHGSGTGIKSIAATILESNQPDAQFGFSVKGAGDVNGDGYSDVIVGAWTFDSGESNEGAAFIYHGSVTGVGVNAVTLLQSNQPLAYFGFSVSTAGDVNGDGFSDVIVGGFLYDNGQGNEGGAFIYQGSANGIGTNVTKLLECNQANAQFGASVSAAGDVNGDGYADVIVGANLYDKGLANEGAAFVYQGSPTGLDGTPVSSLESDQKDASFGVSVSSAGDVNGDGYSDIVAGAQLYDNSQADEGAAFVWLGGGRGTFSSPTELTGQQDQSNFGQSVANAGDVNGDGYSDFIVGAPSEAPKGAAYIYYGGTQGVNVNNVTKIDNVANSATFAYSVAGAGDVNGDGYDDVVIGDMNYFVSFDAQKGLFNGTALVFYGSNQGINKNTFTVIKNSTQPQCSFGWVVASAGDVNGDGYDDVLVGDPNYDKQFDEGAAFVYHGSSQGISTTAAITLEGTQASEELGLSVASAGDVNGDGFDDIILGAPFYSNGQNAEGAALVYFGSGAGIAGAAKVIESNSAGAVMGTSVSGAGDLNGDGFSDIAIGSPEFVVNAASKGVAVVYHGSSAGVNDASKTILDIGQIASFGNSISDAGDFNGDGYGDLIVGAFNYSQTINAAFMYFGSMNGISPQVPIKLESNKVDSRLGTSVACAGDINGDGYSDVLIGAPLYSVKGTVFVCKGNNGAGFRNNLRLYNSNNLTTPINHTQFPLNNFGAGLFAKSFLGRNKGKLLWETKPLGQGFSKGSNNAITNSTQSTNSQGTYTDLGLAGAELKNVINKQGPGTKVRVRVKYNPVLALTGQTYGPWRYLPAYLMGTSTAPVPEEAKNDISQIIKNEALMNLENEPEEQVVVYPNPTFDRINIRVKNPELVQTIKILDFNGAAAYKVSGFKSSIDVSKLSEGVYFVLVVNQDGTHTMSKILIRE